MEIIAHRGGSFGKENSLETMITAAKSGVYAVECDIRKTKDGVLVIYHDDSIFRLTGKNINVLDVTFSDMQKYHEEVGVSVLTFDRLKNEYKEKTPILLHVKLSKYDLDFAKYVASSNLPLIVGVCSLEMLNCFAKFLPPENILAFLPSYDLAKEFYDNGCGIIRLWEQWLDEITPSEVKSICPNAKVFIMACNVGKTGNKITLETMDGSEKSLELCYKLNADAVLLNDVEMALNWKNKQ